MDKNLSDELEDDLTRFLNQRFRSHSIRLAGPGYAALKESAADLIKAVQYFTDRWVEYKWDQLLYNKEINP